MAAASLFKSLVLIFLTEHCYDEFFVEFNFFDVPCLKAAISKGLGTLIILGSVIVKLPQILKIFGAKSGEGISILSVVFELVAISATWSYSVANGYPFTAWGESFFLAVQSCAIGSLCLHYGGSTSKAGMFTGVYIGIMYILLSGIVPYNALAFLQSMNILMVIISRMMQAYSNFSAGNTGQLSSITFLMLFLGSIARIFTSIQETGDPFMIATYIISTTCNGIIFGQIIYYSGAKTKKE